MEKIMDKNDNVVVSVFGLGYVGCVSLACLYKAGFKVIGVDSNESKVDLLNNGMPTIVEPGLDDLILKGSRFGLISATLDAEFAILNSDIILVTVGTPSLKSGDLDFTHVYSVAETIGQTLKSMNKFLTIAIRSTIKPGTCAIVEDIIERVSGKSAGSDFSVVSNPEFLREGSAINDYENPPYVLIGSKDKRGFEILSGIYKSVNAEILHVKVNTAEIIKYLNNSWHALKVAFGNEVGTICKELKIDSYEVVELFCKDTILNISPYYLKPGFAFGGACLPKDLSAFVALSESNGIEAPLISNIFSSNISHIKRATDLIRKIGIGKKIGILGLSFKNNTDDVRNSPIVEILNNLRDESYNFKIYDSNVNFALSSGRNVPTTRSILHNLEDFMVEEPEDIINFAEVIVIANKNKKFLQIVSECKNIVIVDLVFMSEAKIFAKEYYGLAW
jgi:GDP-mannose 6-dehydrogenase